ncbi:MAG: hypothetical protein U0401_24750 [Anaerolineae bacterium]
MQNNLRNKIIKFLKNLGLLIFGLVMGLLLVEFLLGLIPEETINTFIARHPIRYHIYQTDPDIGWRLKPNAQYQYMPEDNQYVLIQTNSNGLNDIESQVQKPEGVYRILILGDSFTEAAQVPIGQNFSRLLADCLNKYYPQPIEVINGGVSYYSSAEELFFLQHVGVQYQPDLVLTAFYVGNDIDTYSARKSQDGWFDTFGGYLIELDETGQLKKQWIDWQNPSPYENVSSIELFLRRHFLIYRLLTHSDSKLADWLDGPKDQLKTFFFGLFAASMPKPPARPSKADYKNDLDLMIFHPDFPDGLDMPPQVKEAWAIIKEVFKQLQTESASINAHMGVLIIPTLEQAHADFYQEAYHKYSNRYGITIAGINWDYTKPDQALGQILSQKNIPYLDLLPAFKLYDATHPNEYLYFTRNGHFNQAGHQLTAEATCQWVKEQQFIPDLTSQPAPE